MDFEVPPPLPPPPIEEEPADFGWSQNPPPRVQFRDTSLDGLAFGFLLLLVTLIEKFVPFNSALSLH